MRPRVAQFQQRSVSPALLQTGLQRIVIGVKDVGKSTDRTITTKRPDGIQASCRRARSDGRRDTQLRDVCAGQRLIEINETGQMAAFRCIVANIQEHVCCKLLLQVQTPLLYIGSSEW